jgi:hypothetical protein
VHPTNAYGGNKNAGQRSRVEASVCLINTEGIPGPMMRFALLASTAFMAACATVDAPPTAAEAPVTASAAPVTASAATAPQNSAELGKLFSGI